MSLFEQALYIIAEVANAAQGSVEDNHRIITAVATTGANAIKLQFYKYDELATPHYEKYENFRRTFFTEEERLSFIDHACKVGLDVIIDIFDRWGLKIACKVIHQIKGVKIPPAIIMDEELVEMILDLKKPTFIGVGGYEDQDIDFLLSKLKVRNNPIVLMHGFQGFPTDEKDSSLVPDEFARMVLNLRRCLSIMESKTIPSSEKDYQKHSNRVTTIREVKAGKIIFRRDVKFRRTDKIDAMFPNQ